MDRIGQTDLLQSISHLGNLNVGNQPSMKEYANDLTTVNFGGTFVMTEGQVLLLTMALVMVVTFLTNAAVWLVLP